MIPMDVYKKHEAIFFKLVINTKKNFDISSMKGDSKIIEQMEKIFRSTPKIQFLHEFFANEGVQMLYKMFKQQDDEIYGKL